jgi:hypothetical protein
MTQIEVASLEAAGDDESIEISREWHRWAAEALSAGRSMSSVVATLSARGIAETHAAALCAEIYLNPVFDAARSESQQRRKLASVLAMQQQMRRLAAEDGVERHSGLSRRDFLLSYYSRNEPVLLEDVCDEWRACAVWSSEYLLERLGDVPVEVMANRESDVDYELNAGAHRTVMSYAAYVAAISKLRASNDLYLVANNKLLESDAAKLLWEDFELDRRYLRPRSAKKRTFLWHGPAGTVTPLHHDTMNVMFQQVVGWKRFTLVPAGETPSVYNTRGVFSEVDAKDPDLGRYPDFANAHPVHVSVGPGEALFIPAGWWHHVEALEPSISVSTTAFVYPNDIQWFSPEVIT